jgi:hypothetical protein
MSTHHQLPTPEDLEALDGDFADARPTFLASTGVIATWRASPTSSENASASP